MKQLFVFLVLLTISIPAFGAEKETAQSRHASQLCCAAATLIGRHSSEYGPKYKNSLWRQQGYFR